MHTGRAMGAATRLQVHLDPARQVGRVHVVHAGPDVQGRVLDHARWMLGGRLRHLEVLVPLDNGNAARAMPAWSASIAFMAVRVGRLTRLILPMKMPPAQRQRA